MKNPQLSIGLSVGAALLSACSASQTAATDLPSSDAAPSATAFSEQPKASKNKPFRSELKKQTAKKKPEAEIKSSEPPPAGWPIPDTCTNPARCKLPDGKPGIQCDQASACISPCRPGMAPNDTGLFCEHLCSQDSDCPGGKCTEEKLCESFPVFDCRHPKECDLPDGHTGSHCKKEEPCINSCKTGLFLSPDGDCAKPCKTVSDCPGGSCEKGFCGPTCPAISCPYLWD